MFDIDAAELINLQLHTVKTVCFKFSDEQRFIREYTDEERNDPEFQEARFDRWKMLAAFNYHSGLRQPR